MQDNCIAKALEENLSSLQEIQNQLQTIKDVKLNSIYSTLTHNNFIKQISNNDKNIVSTLCVKVKNKNIRQVQFGLCVDIGCDVIDDYLQDKEITNIQLNFHLQNLSTEQNSAYFVQNIDNKSHLASFITKNNQQNCINLTKNINLLKEEIKQNNRISFFIPMFESYDNYDEFYEAIHNVILKIYYFE